MDTRTNGCIQIPSVGSLVFGICVKGLCAGGVRAAVRAKRAIKRNREIILYYIYYYLLIEGYGLRLRIGCKSLL